MNRDFPKLAVEKEKEKEKKDEGGIDNKRAEVTGGAAPHHVNAIGIRTIRDRLQ